MLGDLFSLLIYLLNVYFKVNINVIQNLFRSLSQYLKHENFFATELASWVASPHLGLLSDRGLDHLHACPLLHPRLHHPSQPEDLQDRLPPCRHNSRLGHGQSAGTYSLPQVELLRHLRLLPPGGRA